VSNPYARYVEGLDPLQCLEETPRRIEALVNSWPRERDERSHAPGKWSARQVLVNLAHIEMVFTTRLRYGLTDDRYAVQPFEQELDGSRVAVDALVALEAYTAMRRMNLALTDRHGGQRADRSPTRVGRITVDWLIGGAPDTANHLPQIERSHRVTLKAQGLKPGAQSRAAPSREPSRDECERH
jgi:hypothetical protein